MITSCVLLLLLLHAAAARPADPRRLRTGGVIRGDEYLDLIMGGTEAQFNYPLKGWSYYIRVYDLFQEPPIAEVGWGQWTKPQPVASPTVCGIHLGGFACESTPSELAAASTPAICAADPTACLANCMTGSLAARETCSYWCCNDEDRCGVRGSIEGGLGYWMYTIEKPQPSWMLPGATCSNYEVFGGTMLNDKPQECSKLGGAVRIANRLLVPNDMVTFSAGAGAFNEDGFLGYMLQRTPIGKRSATDDANYWTIVVDAENFAGPVMYMASWFWDQRVRWHPNATSWSDPRALLGYIATGFEGKTGAMKWTDPTTGDVWHRVTAMGFPTDTQAGGVNRTFTLMTGFSEYNNDWLNTVLEPILDGADTTSGPADIVAASQNPSNRGQPGCGRFPAEARGVELLLPEDSGYGVSDDERRISGFGISPDASDASHAEAVAASCARRYVLDASKLDCDSKSGYCLTSVFVKNKAVVKPSDVPARVKDELCGKKFKPVKVKNAQFTSPSTDERHCFERPGPAASDSRLYCVRTSAKAWIGFRWYRFVDQPELAMTFASLPDAERAAAKAYVQARVERLHAMQQRDAAAVPRWFRPPQSGGAAALPATRVSIDAGLLLTPPAGLEVGYVPIPVSQRLRVKPAGCEVTVGAHATEPEPLPADYYDIKYDANNNDVSGVRTYDSYPSRDVEVCSSTGGHYPGEIFPYPPTGISSTWATKMAYKYDVPVRAGIQAELQRAFPATPASITWPTETWPAGAPATESTGDSLETSQCRKPYGPSVPTPNPTTSPTSSPTSPSSSPTRTPTKPGETHVPSSAPTSSPTTSPTTTPTHECAGKADGSRCADPSLVCHGGTACMVPSLSCHGKPDGFKCLDDGTTVKVCKSGTICVYPAASATPSPTASGPTEEQRQHLLTLAEFVGAAVAVVAVIVCCMLRQCWACGGREKKTSSAGAENQAADDDDHAVGVAMMGPPARARPTVSMPGGPISQQRW